MRYKYQFKSISDDELLRRLAKLLQQSRRVESELVAHIAEVDRRNLYLGQACSSMFTYCTEVLHLSEAEAYLRIKVARASRQHPILLEMLSDGRLHLSGISRLAPFLTEANRDDVLKRAAWKSKRQIEALIAELSPRPDVPALMRKLPARRARAQSTPTTQLGPDRVGPAKTPVSEKPALVAHLSPSRFKVQFTASADLHDKLERLRALMRSSVPDGDLAAIIEDAVTEKLERLESRRYGKTKAPRKSLKETDTSAKSRHIPAAVKRAVRARDGNRCTFVDHKGRRCTECKNLEFHHGKPYGRGGDHKPMNVFLMCRAHNAYLAEKDYGKEVIERHRRSGNRVSEPAAIYTVSNRVAFAQYGSIAE